MALISIGFQAYSPYVDNGVLIPLSSTSGAAPPINFSAYYGPELGCLGIGTGPGVYTQTGVVTDIEARVTDMGRAMLARAITDGTALKIVEMALGSSGYDPSDPTRALWVDPASTQLENEILRRDIDHVEQPGYLGSRGYVCRFDQDSFVGGVGEIALWAEILDSPDPAEVGTQFMFALAHQGLNTKTKHHLQSYRVFVTV